MRGYAKRIVLTALLAAILICSKYALDFLPNIELVSLLIIIYVLVFPKLCIGAVYTYIVLYGLLNGFGIWWFPQLYIWLILIIVARLFSHNSSSIFWAVVSGFYGLAYGALYAVSYGLFNGAAAGVAWWITGIPFDIMHCLGNVVVALLLFKPLYIALNKFSKKLGV